MGGRQLDGLRLRDSRRDHRVTPPGQLDSGAAAKTAPRSGDEHRHRHGSLLSVGRSGDVDVEQSLAALDHHDIDRSCERRD